MRRSMWLAAAVAIVAAPAVVRAQNAPTPNPQEHPPLEVGAVAPDFELPGATRWGLLEKPVRLSDYKGETVVLAFFYKARTKG